MGEGAYEGLSAIIFTSDEHDMGEAHGLIYEGAPLREPPTEYRIAPPLPPAQVPSR